jgi:hypothetical protein
VAIGYIIKIEIVESVELFFWNLLANTSFELGGQQRAVLGDTYAFVVYGIRTCLPQDVKELRGINVAGLRVLELIEDGLDLLLLLRHVDCRSAHLT